MVGGCNPNDKTVIVYRSTSRKCQDDSSKFAFDPVRGIIIFVIGHKFSTRARFSDKADNFSKKNYINSLSNHSASLILKSKFLLKGKIEWFVKNHVFCLEFCRWFTEEFIGHTKHKHDTLFTS